MSGIPFFVRMAAKEGMAEEVQEAAEYGIEIPPHLPVDRLMVRDARERRALC